jgi:peptide/nickel transport system substrate-binding protein
LALLAACGPPAAPAGGGAQGAPAAGPTVGTAEGASATQQPAAAPAGAAGSPKKGGTLRVGLIVDVATLDPHLSGSKVDRQVYHNLYDPLVVLDDKLGIQPNLVESWSNPDPKTLCSSCAAGQVPR